jgi:hypothetical protein
VIADLRERGVERRDDLPLVVMTDTLSTARLSRDLTRGFDFGEGIRSS